MEVNMYMGLAHFIPRNHTRQTTTGKRFDRAHDAPIIAAAETFGAIMVAELLAAGVVAHVRYEVNSTVFSTYQCNAPSPVCELAAHAPVLGRCMRIFKESMADWCSAMEASA